MKLVYWEDLEMHSVAADYHWKAAESKLDALWETSPQVEDSL